MDNKQKIELLLEALRVLTKDEDAKERHEIREKLVRELRYL
jgi:hypothetical protein